MGGDTTLYLSYQETRHGGDICEGDEDSDWPQREDEEITFSPISLNRTGSLAKWDKESVTAGFDPPTGTAVWLVIARYTDGGTFGRTTGYWHVAGVCPDPTVAETVREAVTSGTYQSDAGYLPWVGYFASLQDVEIHQMTVED